MLLTPPPLRSTVSEQPDGLRISIPAPRNTFTNLFLIFWLAMWAYAENQVGREVILDNKWDLFTVAWLGVWTFAGGSAAHACLWNLFGKDVLTLCANELQLHRQILCIGFLRRFPSADLHNLRFVPECGCGRAYRMRLIPAFFFLVTISTTALACPGGLGPGFDTMIKDSTLIVRGQVLWEIGDNQWNPQGQRQHWSDVLIERAYKGASSSDIRVSWKEYFACPRARVHKDDYGLFFLRASGSEFVLVDEQYGKLAVSRWQDDSQGLDPFVAFERDFKRAIQNDSGRQLIEDVLLLGSLRRPIDTAELRALLPTNNEVLESAVHLALLKLHDYSELETSGRLVETVPASRSFRLPEQEAAYLRTEIGSEIGRIEDPRQLPILQRFTLSSNVWLRESAAYAVRHLHDFSSVRYLIRLIDDPSEETRIQAIRGLTELLRPGIEGYGWLPGTPLNGREVTEQEVIARWRAWWQAEGESKYRK